MQKKIKILISFLIVALGLMGCNSLEGESAKDSTDLQTEDLASITVELETTEQPIETGVMNPYIVLLKDQQGNPVEVDSVHFYMNMDMMNHPTQGTMQQKEAGAYTLDLPLAMKGEWYTIITLRRGEQSIEIKDFKIQAEGEKHMEYMRGYDADNK